MQFEVDWDKKHSLYDCEGKSPGKTRIGVNKQFRMNSARPVKTSKSNIQRIWLRSFYCLGQVASSEHIPWMIMSDEELWIVFPWLHRGAKQKFFGDGAVGTTLNKINRGVFALALPNIPVVVNH